MTNRDEPTTQLFLSRLQLAGAEAKIKRAYANSVEYETRQDLFAALRQIDEAQSLLSEALDGLASEAA